MTDAPSEAAGRRFVVRVLPWLLGAAGFLVYLLTLNHWVSFYNLGTVARSAGWLWQPQVGLPLTQALFYPFSWLPAAWLPLALNIFNAACAALVLVLLARSVALLPHDLAPDEPFRKDKPISLLTTPTAWMPPVLAAILGGLQLSFWEHATSASGEMLDLLVFAGVIWCLLEFRISQKQAWLSRASLLFGLGMANHWLMLGYFPIFIVALLRAKHLGPFLEPRFLIRMTLWGLVGLSACLLLPLVRSAASHDPSQFWPALKTTFNFERAGLAALHRPALRALLLTSLLPIAVLSFRWKSHTVQFGDDSRLGVFLTKATGHVVHGLFWFCALWLALDPTFSPRHLALGTPMLSYYFLAALLFGYCTGYFLLLGLPRTSITADPRPVLSRSAAASAPGSPYTAGAGWVLLALLPLTLCWRNLDQILTTNSPAVRDFAEYLYSDLPAGECTVLSEDSRQILLLEAAITGHGHAKNPLPLETTALAIPAYRQFMARRFASRWPALANTNGASRPSVGAAVAEDESTQPTGSLQAKADLQQEPSRPYSPGTRQMLQIVGALAVRESLVYLHPSSGLFFESSVAQPHGLVHWLGPRPAGEAYPPLPNQLIDANQQLWKDRWSNALSILAGLTRGRTLYSPAWAGPLLRRLRLANEPNPTATWLGAAYSKTLNYWAVDLERAARESDAAVWFQRAIELNPQNLAARFNLAYNERRRQGDKTRLGGTWAQHQFPELATRYRDWREVLSAGGPVDEPTSLLRTGRLMLASRNPRQAANAFIRAAALAPDWAAPKLWLAETRIYQDDLAGALALTDMLQSSNAPVAGAGLAQLLYCRAAALQGAGRTNEATACIEHFIQVNRGEPEVLSAAADLYAADGQYAPALSLLEELLARDPNQPALLVRKGSVEMQLARYDEAIATLTKALSLGPANEQARIYRAMARLRSGQFERARKDFETVLQARENSELALFGLGTVAWRQHETNTAVGFYERFLSNAIPESVRYRLATERLKELAGRGR